ncbi:MAG: LysM peptidoglycan-binding domain-containing protein [Spirochaetia bacterium]|jgi:LysM repeat protein|nr:LysM peptidoglycan-binding domain-containing protein [Spirochaetales bacterium]MDX9783769.1 LysM peptidoglycan-binding domain-containing protein [Spirochaetia bacterium]
MRQRASLTIAAVFFLFSAAFLAAAEEQASNHTLAKGETLYSVSRKYNVPYEALAAANNITDPTKMRIGTILVIPSVHRVAKGETLYGIARQYGISLQELLSANKLTSSYILKIDDILVIPGKKDGTTVDSNLIPPPQGTVVKADTPTPSTVSSSSSTSLAPSTQAQASPSPAAQQPVPQQPTVPQQPVPAQQPASVAVQPQTAVPLPEPVKTHDKAVDLNIGWPAKGHAMYLDGKLEGVMFKVEPGESAKTVASGTVVSAGPSRGFNQVAFVQAKSGYVYVYGGNETLYVKTGDQLDSGEEIGRIGLDAKDGSPIAYFFVFRNGQPIDPALAPRD